MAARPWLILAALALGRAAFGYQLQSVATLAPMLLPRYGISWAELGGLIGAYMLPGIAVALPGGLLGRRFGDAWAVMIGLVLMSIGPLVVAHGGGTAGIAAGRMIAGAGAVLIIVMQGKIVADWFPPRHFMLAIGVTVGAFPVGVGLAQVTLAPLAHAIGLAGAFAIGAAPTVLASLIFLLSWGKPPNVTPPPRRFSMPSRRESALVIVAGLVWTAYTSGYAAFLAYTPSLMATRGESPAMAAAIIGIATWGNLPANLAGGWLGEKFGEGQVFLYGTLACALGCFGMALADLPLLWALLFGVLGSIQAPAIMAAGTFSTTAANRAVGMGLFYTVYYAGNALAPTLCGAAADRFGGPAAAIATAAVLSLLPIPAWMAHRALGRRLLAPVG